MRTIQRIAGWSLILQGVILMASSVAWSWPGFDANLFGLAIGIIIIAIGYGLRCGLQAYTSAGIGATVLALCFCVLVALTAIYGPFDSKRGHTEARATWGTAHGAAWAMRWSH